MADLLKSMVQFYADKGFRCTLSFNKKGHYLITGLKNVGSEIAHVSFDHPVDEGLPYLNQYLAMYKTLKFSSEEGLLFALGFFDSKQ